MANPSSARAGRPISAIAIEAAPARDARRRSRRDNLLRIAISPMCQSHRNDVLPMPPGQWLAMPYALDQNQDDGGVISTSAIGTNAHEPFRAFPRLIPRFNQSRQCSDTSAVRGKVDMDRDVAETILMTRS